MDSSPLYVILHLPKTGGTTITGHLSQHLPPQEVLFLGPKALQERQEKGLAPPEEWPEERLAPIRVIAGHGADATSHSLLPSRPVRQVTIVRDPAPLMVSRFNFDVSRSGEAMRFEDWYPGQRPNPTLRRLRRLLGEQDLDGVASALEGFWFVGVTEHLDDDLPHLFSAIGVPPAWTNRRVAGGGKDVAELDLPGAAEAVAIERHATLTDHIRDRVHQDHARDLRLYRLALRLRQARRVELGWDDATGDHPPLTEESA
jgi:hypothetical protein